MKYSLHILCCLLMVWPMRSPAQDNHPHPSFLNWSQLPALPGTPGLAGCFAGVSNGTLLVAGGANFPDGGTPWTGSAKVWHNKVYALESPTGQWKEAGMLPRSLGYGVSVTWRDGLICMGGSDVARHYADVFMLRYTNGRIQTETLPALPRPLANTSGVLIGDVIYIAGGTASPTATATESVCWSLDLSAPEQSRQWKTLPAWPGPSRMLAVAGALDGAFYLISGVELVKGKEDSTAHRVFLKDAYRYSPAKGWVRIADVPEPVAAAPSPAFTTGQSHLLVFGGDHGQYFEQNAILKEKHPGFSDKVWGYNNITNAWSVMDTVLTAKQPDAAAQPNNSVWAPVTTPAVVWNGSLVLPSGEVRPAVRTPRVLMATPVQPPGAFKLLDWIIVGIYFLLVIGISVIVSRKMESSTSDFFLGGGKIPWWAAGLSIFGSKLSALTFIAIPAKAYATDWVYLLNNIMIVAVAPLIVYFYLPYFRKMQLTSVYEYLRIRFNQRVKLLGSLTFVLFQVSRLGIVIYLPALVLSAVTGINIFVCIIGITVITTAYSVSGGIEAVVWTEVMQVVVLLGGALMALVFMANSLPGGFGQLFTEAAENNKFRMAIMKGNITEPVLWVVLVGGFLTQLVTYSSDQVVVQRYLTTPTEKEARKSIYTNALLVIPASLIFFCVGTALWVFFKHNPAALNPHGRIDDIFPWYISNQLPSGLAGLVIAGLFAATMSTISSSMNSIATVVTTDFYQYLKPASTDRQRFAFARRTTVVLGGLGFLIAIYMVYLSNASIWDQYLKIIGLFGGCLAGMFVAGIFFPRINSMGIFIGFIISAICLFFVQAANIISFFLYPAVAVLVCVLVGYVSSLIWKEKAGSLRPEV
ncbi:sodium/solute symporter [Pseudoflavitalea sp. X16]|uniref:sodium:solute symporter family transporter n=1 Tax=Paraflavitalea devenefica TaxID=2716334 RepID=UPI00142204A1|nr:sodium/solute symporter [Paraflavitalea devenefica]NII26299.1 sodium/solute symporter [Paraflavitalea devenefica]